MDTPSPEMARWCALFVTIAMAIPTATAAISLVEAERTGIAWYAPNSTSLPERVSKSGWPEKFSDAIALDVWHIIYSGSISLISFWFYRRLSR
jgi:hypothetical protein